MGNIVQRLVNKYPDWSNIRQDPSSFGHRMYSVWGDYFDWAYADGKRITESYQILQRGLGLGYTYHCLLEPENYMSYTTSIAGDLIWTYPTVIGTLNSIDYTPTRVDNLDDLFWSLTTRIASDETIGVENTLIYSDDRVGNVINNEIDYPVHLSIVIGPSTNFFKKTPRLNPKASGYHFIIINGYDLNAIEVKEYVYFSDDGIYTSKNIFTEILEVIPEGFDGPFSLYIGEPMDYILDPYRAIVIEELEGPSKLSLSTDTDTILTYFTIENMRGEDYRDGNSDPLDISITKWNQYLFDSDGESITAIDMAINHNNLRLYVLSDDGRIHIYEHGISNFTPPSLESTLTKVSYVDLIPIKHWALLDEDILFFTRFTRMRYPILTLKIYRKSPSGVLEYLQADKTWDVTVYTFQGIHLGQGLPNEDSWNDFSFTTTPDAIGKWEFYCEVKTDRDTTINTTGILVDGINALASFDTDVTEPHALFFGPNDQIVVVSDTDGTDGEEYSFITFNEYSDVYYPDPLNQILYFRESYDEVTVS